MTFSPLQASPGLRGTGAVTVDQKQFSDGLDDVVLLFCLPLYQCDFLLVRQRRPEHNSVHQSDGRLLDWLAWGYFVGCIG